MWNLLCNSFFVVLGDIAAIDEPPCVAVEEVRLTAVAPSIQNGWSQDLFCEVAAVNAIEHPRAWVPRLSKCTFALVAGLNQRNCYDRSCNLTEPDCWAGGQHRIGKASFTTTRQFVKGRADAKGMYEITDTLLTSQEESRDVVLFYTMALKLRRDSRAGSYDIASEVFWLLGS
jgi:hypothetical protein